MPAHTESPTGTLTLQTISMPADTNPFGDIFGGWVMAQMDIAGAIHANEVAKGRVTTVAVGSMSFIRPVPVGAIISCYTSTRRIGNTSIRVWVEVWIKDFLTQKISLVTEGEYIYVALDEQGHKRPVRLGNG
ncbi:acyl-CoA thioesterase [Cellvibrio japonicus]|uniref:Acyl-CoA hydrolase n=1 Tax=Cellvibrio japonicus (strain Ueda107) TaxID=498211 RepID=B3PGE2_CELJU|nr:acyl-CoA thioesterase [Cellvibrio japonicus]ACE84604.1 acyl-CoA hydrolase [Cellvibrio japonicus Ueda107]QEI10934.1 acyl-CoA thioesterase [Cellvibrio japonicus]QEI14510.1 acyl-CoA thioesterase [Cellvibrio japonicus]QEI18088.1 acyl-CoA thioesterase [Cellvibrio japonicus]